MVEHFLSILSFKPHTNLIVWVFALAYFMSEKLSAQGG